MRKSLLLILIQTTLFVSSSGGNIGLQQTPNPNSADEPIRTLAVKITTDRARGAGTDNTVYFDIGPLAWKLDKPSHNDFESGATDTYDLIRDGKIVNMKNAPNVTITRGDILWWRLHKKGIVGVTGFGDGFDGAWHPQFLTLTVNDDKDETIEIKQPLNSLCWYWRSKDPDPFDLHEFAQSLRMIQNNKLKTIDKLSGVVTTNLFKRQGVSGWLRNPISRQCVGNPPTRAGKEPLPPICADGIVRNVASSTDGLETIDLQVTRIAATDKGSAWQPKEVSLDGFSQPRYLRVENSRAHHRVTRDKPARICGDLLWDTDLEGWWEIHPRSSADLPAHKE